MTAARDPSPDLLAMPWRTGGAGGLAVLALVGESPSRQYLLVGVMASAVIAAEVVTAHNARLSAHPWAGDVNRVIRERLAAVECEDSPAA